MVLKFLHGSTFPSITFVYVVVTMRTLEDRSGPLVTCIDNPGRSPVLTGELVPVDRHGLPVQVTNGPDRSSEVLIWVGACMLVFL